MRIKLPKWRNNFDPADKQATASSIISRRAPLDLITFVQVITRAPDYSPRLALNKDQLVQHDLQPAVEMQQQIAKSGIER